MRLDVFVHQESDKKLDTIIGLLQAIQTKENLMSAELDALAVQVKANTDLEASAVSLIQGIAAQLTALKNDPAAITALSTQLASSASALAAAITANTPAAPPAPATP